MYWHTQEYFLLSLLSYIELHDAGGSSGFKKFWLLQPWKTSNVTVFDINSSWSPSV